MAVGIISCIKARTRHAFLSLPVEAQVLACRLLLRPPKTKTAAELNGQALPSVPREIAHQKDA